LRKLNLNRRINKNEAVILAKDIAILDNIPSYFYEILKNGTEREIFNLLWVFRNFNANQLKGIAPLFSYITTSLDNNRHSESILREGLGLWVDMDIPEEIENSLLNIAISSLESSSATIAVKSFSMSIAYKIAVKYPEILAEVKFLIENNLVLYGEVSSGIKSKALKILNKIKLRVCQ
jgi:hypothetical protein